MFKAKIIYVKCSSKSEAKLISILEFKSCSPTSTTDERTWWLIETATLFNSSSYLQLIKIRGVLIDRRGTNPVSEVKRGAISF